MAFYVNNFYHSVERSIQLIDNIQIIKPENKELDIALRDIEIALLHADTLIKSNQKIYGTPFFRNATYFLDGISITLNDTRKAYVPPLNQDSMLNDNDIIVLQTINSYLLDVKESMYSEETKQVDTNLSIANLNDILKTYLVNNSINFFEAAFGRTAYTAVNPSELEASSLSLVHSNPENIQSVINKLENIITFSWSSDNTAVAISQYIANNDSRTYIWRVGKMRQFIFMKLQIQLSIFIGLQIVLMLLQIVELACIE